VVVVRFLRVCFFLLAFGATATAASSPVVAQSTLSEKLTEILKEAQRAEAQRLYERAIELYQQVLNTGLSDAAQRRELLKLRAIAYERTNELIKAEIDLTDAINVEPVDPLAYADRGYFYLRRGRYPDALDDFVAGSRLAPKKAAFQYGAGRVLVAMRNDLGAVALYNEAISLDPRDGANYLARAEARIRLKQFDEATADYTRALKLRLKTVNDWFFAYLGRGYARLQRDQNDGAVQDFDEALRLIPKDLQALTWRGRAHERRGDIDQAIEDYERAHQLAPTDNWVRVSLQRLRSY
jgi:tetratricopeptide (TPR) repeat protein